MKLGCPAILKPVSDNPKLSFPTLTVRLNGGTWSPL